MRPARHSESISHEEDAAAAKQRCTVNMHLPVNGASVDEIFCVFVNRLDILGRWAAPEGFYSDTDVKGTANRSCGWN